MIMEKYDDYDKEKKLFYVKCAFDEKHVFEKVFPVLPGEKPAETTVETFCPYCERMVEVQVEGEVPDKTAELLRRFKKKS